MQNSLLIQSAKIGVNRLLLLQMVVTVLIVISMGLLLDTRAAYSALIGGAICVVTSWYFARRFFAHSGARHAKQIIKSFYLAELLKFLFSIILFSLAFYFMRVRALPFFISYIITQWMFWFAPWLFKSNRTVRV